MVLRPYSTLHKTCLSCIEIFPSSEKEIGMENRLLLTSALFVVAASSSAYAANDSTFGPAASTAVSNGGSYSGISLTATDANNGSGGFGSYTSAVNLFDLDTNTGLWDVPVSFDIHTDQPVNFGPAGSEGFGSTLTIRAGQASGATTVNLRVRKPNDNEVFGFSTEPPAENSPGWYSLLSDVFEIDGIVATGATTADGRTPTDPFAVQISYLDNNLAHTNTTPEAYMEDYIYEHGNVKGWTEADIAAAGELQIAYFDQTTGQYSADDLGVFNPGSTVVINYQGSWDAFAAEYSVTDANVGDFVGSSGVDTVNNNVWAVVDRNSPFVVVPEPHSMALLGLSILLVFRRRR